MISGQTVDDGQAALEAIDKSVEERAEILMEQAESTWPSLAAMFVDAQNALNQTVYELALFYNSTADQAMIREMLFMGSRCPVKVYSTLMNNITESNELICCHMQHMRFPNIIHLISSIKTKYLGISAWSSNPMPLINELRDIQKIEQDCLLFMACSEDIRIMRAECLVLRVMPLALLIEKINDVYVSVQLDARVIKQACVDRPMNVTGCIYNQTVTPDELPLFSQSFINYDIIYQDTCGPSKIRFIESKRSSPSCS